MTARGASKALRRILGTDLPLIQAPMAGVQGSTLAVAVANAGGLGSLPCAMLTVEAMRKELAATRAGTTSPYNVNFFCHTPPAPSAASEAAWRKLLKPYFDEYASMPIPSRPAPAALRSAASGPMRSKSSNRA